MDETVLHPASRVEQNAAVSCFDENGTLSSAVFGELVLPSTLAHNAVAVQFRCPLRWTRTDQDDLHLLRLVRLVFTTHVDLLL
jgi:hypothetical protein